jgi:hypothetical protein
MSNCIAKTYKPRALLYSFGNYSGKGNQII